MEFVLQKNFEDFLDKKAKKAKNILAIGEANHNFSEMYTDLNKWRFKRLHNINKNIIGVDILMQNIKDTKKLGYDFRYMNIEDQKSITKAVKDTKFDLILMIDVIEHLSNTGMALENLSKLLTPKGELIITTPNPFYFRETIKTLFGKKSVAFYDHTNYTTHENMLQLAERHNLKPVTFHYLHFMDSLSKPQQLIIKGMHKFNPMLLNHNLFIMKKAK